MMKGYILFSLSVVTSTGSLNRLEFFTILKYGESLMKLSFTIELA